MAMTSEEWTSAFRKIVDNDHSRRELLWLRAKELANHEHADSLVAVDPAIKARLWFFYDVNFCEIDAMEEIQRCWTYGCLYEVHLKWLIE